MEIEKKINSIIANFLNIPSKSIGPNTVAKDFEKWDSLNNIKIFIELSKINTNLKMSDFTKAKKVGDIYKLLKK